MVKLKTIKKNRPIQSKLMIFQGLDERLQETENCPVCWEKLADVTQSVTPCGHLIVIIVYKLLPNIAPVLNVLCVV